MAVIISHVTGKGTGVVIFNTDKKEGRFEFRIKTACEKAVVSYISYPYPYLGFDFKQ